MDGSNNISMDSLMFPQGVFLPPQVYCAVHLWVQQGSQTDRDKQLDFSFNPDYAKALVKTCAHVFHIQKGVIYGFISGEEIIILIDVDATGGKLEAIRLLTRLTAHCSARLTTYLNSPHVFEGRTYLLPRENTALDFFTWVQEQAAQGALDDYCKNLLKESCKDVGSLNKIVQELGNDEKHEILSQHGLDFYDDVPQWERLGTAIYRKQAGEETSGLAINTKLPESPMSTQFLAVALGLAESATAAAAAESTPPTKSPTPAPERGQVPEQEQDQAQAQSHEAAQLVTSEAKTHSADESVSN